MTADMKLENEVRGVIYFNIIGTPCSIVISRAPT